MRMVSVILFARMWLLGSQRVCGTQVRPEADAVFQIRRIAPEGVSCVCHTWMGSADGRVLVSRVT